MAYNYTEVRLVFNQYISVSLKARTSRKRTSGKKSTTKFRVLQTFPQFDLNLCCRILIQSRICLFTWLRRGSPDLKQSNSNT